MTEEKEIKCIVWDLDDTIWSGTILENSNVILKDGIVDIIKTLDERGILHSIASKNDFKTAMDKLEEFGISDYFLYPEISWDNKSASIKKVSQNLNISTDHVLFIDDTEFERDEVSYVLPEVTCLGSDMYSSLPDRPELQPRFITDDTIRRREMYIEDIKRKNDESNYSGPKEEFLESLNMQLLINLAKERDLQRIEELTIRTNQLNTTGRTYDYYELKEMLTSENYVLLTAELDDIYGSYGKIGLVLIEKLPGEWRIKLFILSCRVMNRGIGTVLLNEIIRKARAIGIKLTAEFINTEKNRIMYITLKFANFLEIENTNNSESVILQNDLSIVNKNPKYIKLVMEKEWS